MIRGRDGQYIFIKGKLHQKDIEILNIYVKIIYWP